MQTLKEVHEAHREQRLKWLMPFERQQRKFVSVPRSAYLEHLYPIWLRNYEPPWFLSEDCDERHFLIEASMMFRVGNYVLMPSLLWLSQIDLVEIKKLSLEECVRKTGGFRFCLWYGKMHPDFETLPVLPGSPPPSSDDPGRPLFTFLDLDEGDINHLVGVEFVARRWLAKSTAGRDAMWSFFHIPPPDPPKSTLHLHLVAGRELELERNCVFYRIPLDSLKDGEQLPFIVDLSRWHDEKRLPLIQLVTHLDQDCLVYGISGISGSGKSVLSEELRKTYDVEVVRQDDFLFPIDQLPKLTEEGKETLPARWPQKLDVDRTHPDAVDWDRLIRRIKQLKKCTSKRFIIVEGHLILSNLKLRRLFDKVLYIDVPDEASRMTVMRRRMARARPGFMSEVEMGITDSEYLPYFNYIWNNHLKFGKPCFQATTIDCRTPPDEAVQSLHHWFADEIEHHLQRCSLDMGRNF